MAEVLQIQIAADVEQAVRNIQEFAKKLNVSIGESEGVLEAFERELKNTEDSLKSLSGSALLTATNRINALKGAINQIKTNNVVQGMNNLGRSTGNANTALVNFGRVVQDAPFGLIGIANNIDPLITSFQQLKAQTGSAGSAFRALGSALIGPAGIAIAVSAVTSALIAFGPELKSIFTTTEGLTEEQKKLAEQTRALADDLAKEVVAIKSLAAVADDDTRTKKERLAAINELRKRYPEYLKGLSDEELLSKGVATATDAITQSLIRRIVVDAARAKLTQQVSDALDKALQTEQALRQEDKLTAQQVQKTDSRYQNYIKTVTGAADVSLLYGKNATLANGQVLKSFGSADLAANRVFSAISGIVNGPLKDLIQNLGGNALDFTGSFGLKDDDAKKINDSADAVKRLTEATREYNANPALVTPAPRQQQAPATDFPQTFDELESSLGIINDLAQSALGQTLNPLIQKAANDAANVAIAFNLISPAIDQAFNALANGENVFESLQQAVKRLIVDLIKAAAIAVALSFIPGGAGLASPLSGAIGKLLGLRGFRANGGPVTGGQPYIVGERGPELFVPNQTGQIVANGGMLGAAQTLTARVDGNDLLFILNRATSAAGRRI